MGDDLSAPISGILEVTTVTLGTPPGSAYVLLVDGTPHPIGITDSFALSDLSATGHEVELSDVPAPCAVAGENPRTITLSPNATTRLLFQVSCAESGPGGSLDITVVTYGAAPDADGYALLVDDDPPRPVGVNDRVVLGDLTGGRHTLRLADVAPNCEIRDTNPRIVEIPQTAATLFGVTCVPPADGVIAYTSNRTNPDGNVMDIFLRDAAGRSLQNITNTPDVNERQPVWSPDGQRIVFGLLDQSGIFVMNADGSNPRPLVAGQLVSGVLWSPDGSRLLFVKENNRLTDELTTYNFATNRLQVLARAPVTGNILGNISGFCWSPDGSRVAYATIDFGRDPLTSGVFTLAATGGPATPLVSATGRRESVQSWSPDGSTIAFVQGASDGREDIFLVAADGSGPATNLTNQPGTYAEATWSPDGSLLAFIAGGFADADLFTVTPNGEQRELTHDRDLYENLSWSPDGLRLLYAKSFEIHFINFDGTGERALTADGPLNQPLGLLNSEAAWRP